MSKRSQIVPLVAVLACLAAVSPRGFAAYAELEKPALTFGKDLSETEKQKVQAVLERKDCKYLGGGWLNAFTSLRYGGDTTACNRFIEALALCPGLEVRVMFFRGGPGVDCEWMVTQNAYESKKIQVRINLASEKLEIEKLYLPPVKQDKPSDDFK